MDGGSEQPLMDEHPWPWLTIHGDGATRVKKVNKKAHFSILERHFLAGSVTMYA
tara:strand:+ start:4099 stop:4260 length:162 start_codon:yes stop_codon:yes gene_type:complete